MRSRAGLLRWVDRVRLLCLPSFIFKSKYLHLMIPESALTTRAPGRYLDFTRAHMLPYSSGAQALSAQFAPGRGALCLCSILPGWRSHDHGRAAALRRCYLTMELHLRARLPTSCSSGNPGEPHAHLEDEIEDGSVGAKRGKRHVAGLPDERGVHLKRADVASMSVCFISRRC